MGQCGGCDCDCSWSGDGRDWGTRVGDPIGPESDDRIPDSLPVMYILLLCSTSVRVPALHVDRGEGSLHAL